MTSRRMISLSISTPGLVKLTDDVYMIDDDSAPTTSPMIDVTPATVVIALDQAINDWKKKHGAWPDTEAGKRAEKKAEAAKRRAAESLFAVAKTDNMAAITTPTIQKWKDGLDGRVESRRHDCLTWPAKAKGLEDDVAGIVVGNFNMV